jgi:hypothetical protein
MLCHRSGPGHGPVVLNLEDLLGLQVHHDGETLHRLPQSVHFTQPVDARGPRNSAPPLLLLPEEGHGTDVAADHAEVRDAPGLEGGPDLRVLQDRRPGAPVVRAEHVPGLGYRFEAQNPFPDQVHHRLISGPSIDQVEEGLSAERLTGFPGENFGLRRLVHGGEKEVGVIADLPRGSHHPVEGPVLLGGEMIHRVGRRLGRR